MGGKLSALTVAEGKLFVNQVETHTVNALDAVSGKPVWSFVAGGRVDSPPTVRHGRVLFGCADGYVYCLKADDGALGWRFRAAATPDQHVAYDQVESVWPLHGSVLVQDDVIWCASGRSMFLDGGIRLLRLDAVTGRKLSEMVMDDRDPESGENLQALLKGLNMPVALPDILVADGKHIYMRSQVFDQNGRRLDVPNPTENIRDQKGETAHLFCPTGFLDDAYWHRSYWVYGRRWASGAGGYFQAGRNAPSGRLLVFDDSTIYGFSRRAEFFRWTTPIERQLFASSKSPEIVSVAGTDAPAKKKKADKAKKKFNAGSPPNAKVAWEWSEDIPMHVRAMVLANETLFIAGPPDVVDEVSLHKVFGASDIQAKFAAQEESWEGKKGMMLWAVSARDGKKLAEYALDSVPVWDGMAAANNRLYLAKASGEIVCFAGQ